MSTVGLTIVVVIMMVLEMMAAGPTSRAGP